MEVHPEVVQAAMEVALRDLPPLKLGQPITKRKRG